MSQKNKYNVFTKAGFKPTQQRDEDGKWSSSDSNFKKWFKDSKMVDENGDPKVVYHGTNADITKSNTLINGKTKAGFQETQTRDETGKWSKKPGKLEDRPCFKEWFKDSKVIDGPGNPKTFYHGTTHEFNEFSKERGNPENDFGIGFYFSNSIADVEANYDEIGPDLTGRIDQYIDRLENENFTVDMTDEELRRRAEAQFVGKVNKIIPVYLSIKNPVVIGAPIYHAEERETFFDYSQNYNDETEEFGEETGTLLDVVESVRNTIIGYGDFSSMDYNRVISDIFEQTSDGLSASDLVSIMKSSEGLMYASGENGELIPGEVIRSVFEDLGFDGIIDNTVSDKFGPARRFGQAMSGVFEDTQHIIAFEPGSIKRTDAKSFCHETDIRKSGAIIIDHKAGFKETQQRDSSGKWSDRFSKEEIQKHEEWFIDPDRDGEFGVKQWEMAIKHYVQNPWRLNSQLRENSEYISEKWLSDRLDYALTKLKKYKGDTWRGIRLSEQEWGELNKNLSSGNILFRAFTSSSKDHDFARGFNDYGMGNERVLMRLIGKTGRDISSFKLSGKFAVQEEVLFPRNTSWEVLKNIELVNEDTGDLYHHVVLKETEKRSTKAGFSETQRRDRSGKWTDKWAGMREFEEDHKNAQVENGAIFDAETGELLKINVGTETQIRWKYSDIELLKGNIMTHNHPNGTYLSPQDIWMTIVNKSASTRAIAGDIYSEVVLNQSRDIIAELYKGSDDAAYRDFEGWTNNTINWFRDQWNESIDFEKNNKTANTFIGGSYMDAINDEFGDFLTINYGKRDEEN